MIPYQRTRLGRRLQGKRDKDVSRGLNMRTGKVVTTSPFVVTIGGTNQTPHRLASYTPAANDIVAVVVQEGDYLVIGKVVG